VAEGHIALQLFVRLHVIHDAIECGNGGCARFMDVDVDSDIEIDRELNRRVDRLLHRVIERSGVRAGV
jgi:hypothetical protein